MATDTLIAILGILVGVLALVATYHIAFRQGVFVQNKLYVNVLPPFFQGEDYPGKCNLVLYGIPHKSTNSTFLFILPLYIVNRSREAIRNVRIVLALDERLDSTWASRQFPKEVTKDSGIYREYVLKNYHHTEYLIDILRIGQRTVLSHFTSFNDKNFGKSCEENKKLQEKITLNSKKKTNKTFFSEVMVLISAENIKEIKFKTTLLITDYKSEIDFQNTQSKSIADDFFENSITFSKTSDYLKAYYSQIFRGETKRVFVNFPKFEIQAAPKGQSIFTENFEIASWEWWEKKYYIISPLKMRKFIRWKTKKEIIAMLKEPFRKRKKHGTTSRSEKMNK